MEIHFKDSNSTSSSISPTKTSNDTERQQSNEIVNPHINRACQVLDIAKDDNMLWKILGNRVANLKECLLLAAWITHTLHRPDTII